MLKIKLTAISSTLMILLLLLALILPAAPLAASDTAIALDPPAGPAGTVVTVSGQDFSSDYYYYIFFDSEFISKGSLDDDGQFSKNLTIS